MILLVSDRGYSLTLLRKILTHFNMGAQEAGCGFPRFHVQKSEGFCGSPSVDTSETLRNPSVSPLAFCAILGALRSGFLRPFLGSVCIGSAAAAHRPNFFVQGPKAGPRMPRLGGTKKLQGGPREMPSRHCGAFWRRLPQMETAGTVPFALCWA